MSIDDQLEQSLYNAIAALYKIPRPHERERILREAVNLCAQMAGWETFFISPRKQ